VCAVLAAAPAYAETSVRGQVLVLDFAEDGFKNHKDRRYAYWDADNDGQAEKCRWFSPGQGLLALDRDGDGAITDSAELFGTMNIDSFATARQLDTEGDMMLTPGDRVSYPRLRVWFDGDGDGRSTTEEIKTLEELGVVVLNLKPGPARGKTDAVQIGAFQRYTNKRIMWQPLAAVNLHCDESDTRPLTAPAPAPEVLAALPDLPAAGELLSLHDAMVRDYAGSRSLFTQVRMLSETSLANLFAPERPLDAWIDEILFRWAGAGEGDRLRAGPYIDGRKLVFLAKVTGRADYLRQGAPAFWDIYAAELAYRKYQTVLAAQLALQTAAVEIFSGYPVSYDRAAGVMRGVKGLDHAALQTLQNIVGRASRPEERRRSWAMVADMVDYVIGFAALSVEDGRRLDAAVQASGDKAGLRDVMNDTLMLLPREIHAGQAGMHLMGEINTAETTLGNFLRTVIKNRDDGEMWIHGPANVIFGQCCQTEPAWLLTLRDERFKARDISSEILVPGALPTALGYDKVLRAERTDKNVRVTFTGYFKRDYLQWSEALLIPTTRK
jgi:hypothetical protein